MNPLVAGITILPGWRLWTAILAILIVSIPLHPEWLVSDVSWMITVCEKMLDGKTLYVDMIETNPPGAVLIYLPAVAFAQFAHILPETAVAAQTYLVGMAVLALTARILPGTVSGGRNTGLFILLPAAAIFFMLPLQAFAQREHYAAMLSFPMVSVFMRFAEERQWPSARARAAAIACAAVMLTIKPIFALPGICVLLYSFWLARSWQPLWRSGILAAGLLGLALTCASLAAFPDYLGSMWVIVTKIYLPPYSHPMALLLEEKVLMSAVVGFAVIGLLHFDRWPLPTTGLMLAAAAGFVLGYIIQGKGFPYQLYPALPFLLIVLGITIYEQLASKRKDALGLAVRSTVYLAAGAFILGLAVKGLAWTRETVSDISWAKGLEKPAVMSLSPDNQVGFPLSRRIGGVWIDKSPAQWIARFTKWSLEFAIIKHADQLKFLKAHYRGDLQSALDLIKLEKPVLILVDLSPHYSFLLRDLIAMEPDFLSDYRIIAEEARIRVMQRKK